MRAKLSPEQREALNEVNRAAIAAARDNETEEEREERGEGYMRKPPGLHVIIKLGRREEG